MSITFDCEGCGKFYTVPDEVAGRTARCKLCGTSNVIPTPKPKAKPAVEQKSAARASDNTKPVPRPRVPAPPKKEEEEIVGADVVDEDEPAPPPKKPRQVPPPVRKKVEEEEEIVGAEVVEDDEPAPPPRKPRQTAPPKKKVEDDEEVVGAEVVEDDEPAPAPPPKKKRLAPPQAEESPAETNPFAFGAASESNPFAFDQDVPAKKVKKKPVPEPEAEEEAEAPRKKPAPKPRQEPVDEEADEEEEAPAAKKLGKKQKKSSARLYWIIGGSAAAVLLLLVGAAAVYFLPSRGAETEDIDLYLPDNCLMISFVRLSDVLKSDVYDRYQKSLSGPDDMVGKIEQRLGVPASAVKQAVIPMRFDKKGFRVMEIVKANRSLSAEAIKSHMAGDWQEEKVGNYTVHVKGPDAFCIVQKDMVVHAATEELRSILERGRKAQKSDALKKCLDEADLSKTKVHVFATGDLNTPELAETLRDSGGFLSKNVGEIEGVIEQFAVAGDVRVQFTYLCKEAKNTEMLKKLHDEEVAETKKAPGLSKGQRASLERIRTSISGKKLLVQINGDGLVNPWQTLNVLGPLGSQFLDKD